MTCAKVVACLAMLVLVTGFVFTQEATQDKGDKAPEKAPKGGGDKSAAEVKPPSHKVEKKPFKIELTVKGVLEAEQTAEISFRPQRMLHSPVGQVPLVIRKVMAHGTPVKKGDLLVDFDTTLINEIIADLEKEKKALEASIKLAEEELPLSEKSAPVELASAETAKKRADQDLKYFLDIGRAETEKQAHMVVKVEKYYAEYAQEQLHQLEKMYKANDLTEETEKIILRRQQQQVEMANFFYQASLIERDYVLKFALPNRERTLKEDQIRADLHLEKTRKTQEPMLAQKKTSLAQMQFNRDRNALKLENLIKDRAAMTIVSPMDGILYFGKFKKGNWTATDDLDNRLVPNGTVSPEYVFLTVVQPRPLVVHVTFEEKDVHQIKPGIAGKAKLAFNPDRKLPAKVASLATLPTTPGKYEAVLTLETDVADANLMPGMACSVKFVPYSKPDAIAIPSKCIHEEDDKFFVYMAAKGGKEVKRDVTPGRTDSDHTEILAGLQEGEEVLLERPDHKAAAKSKASGAEKGKGGLQ